MNMTNQTQEGKNFWKLVKDNWFILVFIAGLIVTWTNFLNADAHADERLNKLEQSNAVQIQTQTTLLVKLSGIETDVQWIKMRLK